MFRQENALRLIGGFGGMLGGLRGHLWRFPSTVASRSIRACAQSFAFQLLCVLSQTAGAIPEATERIQQLRDQRDDRAQKTHPYPKMAERQLTLRSTPVSFQTPSLLEPLMCSVYVPPGRLA